MALTIIVAILIAAGLVGGWGGYALVGWLNGPTVVQWAAAVLTGVWSAGIAFICCGIIAAILDLDV